MRVRGVLSSGVVLQFGNNVILRPLSWGGSLAGTYNQLFLGSKMKYDSRDSGLDSATVCPQSGNAAGRTSTAKQLSSALT